MEEKNALLFEDYLQKKLSEDERIAFEKKLKEDADFNEAFLNYKQLSIFLKNKFSKERAALQKTLSQTGEDYFSSQKQKVFRLKPWHYSIAASVLLLFGVFLYMQNNRFSYNDYAFSQTITLVERSDDMKVYKNAETAFNTKNYKEAIRYFNQILKTEPTNFEILFYKGIALVETDSFTAAELVFTKLQETNSIYKNKALFYLGLSKLKQKDYKDGKAILNTIPASAAEYKKAQEILKKID